MKNLNSIVHCIDNTNILNKWIEKTESNNENLLLIIDLFQKWSGYCETLTPTFHSLQMRYADKISFLSLEIPKFAKQIQALECDIADCGGGEIDAVDGILKNLSTRGCSPLFVAIRNNKIVAMIEGADPPLLEKTVDEQVSNLTNEGEDEKENYLNSSFK